MKSGTDSKLKFKQLQRRLKLTLWEARGLLDTVWQFTSNNAPDGGIGRYSDEEIAIGIDWDRTEPGELIDVLVATRWLDERAGPRLVVHDWPDHCEHTVHNAIARKISLFADGTIPKFTRLERDERPQIIAAYEDKYGAEAVEKRRAFPDALDTPAGSPSLALPSPSMPCPSPPSQADSAPTPAAAATVVVSWETVLEALQQAGVLETASAIQFAQKAKLPPQEALAIIGHFTAHPGAWKHGAILSRLRTAIPGKSASEGWPSPAPEFTEKVKTNGKARLRDFSAKIDSLSEAYLVEIMDKSAPPPIRERFRIGGREDGVVRNFLAEHLAKGPSQ